MKPRNETYTFTTSSHNRSSVRIPQGPDIYSAKFVHLRYSNNKNLHVINLIT